MSSSYHPHAGLGYCPNLELLQFMSLATSGAYLQLAPQIDPSEPYLYDMNIYHEVSDDTRHEKNQITIRYFRHFWLGVSESAWMVSK